MKKSLVAFDTDKYIEIQREEILKRISSFDGKLYLEFGGKLFDDNHAARVLPGFAPDSKLKVLLSLKEQAEIVIVINSFDINSRKIRNDLGITYEAEVERLIESYTYLGLDVNSVVFSFFEPTPHVLEFQRKLKHRGINVFKHYKIAGYPQDLKTILSDDGLGKNEYIETSKPLVVITAPGPGSGKTRVLVHKLASLLLLEDVKHEQLLMLTFSRAAATEFKQRLMELIGNAAHFVEIKTFHSYCFDLLGRIGNLEDANDVVSQAAKLIAQGEVEPNRIGKTVLVIDEAQDMSADEYALVEALMTVNEEMRVIAVGDDDQNIYEFRGSDSQHMQKLAQIEGSRFIEMTDNYRSSRHVVNVANRFASYIRNRLKQTPIHSMSNEEGWVSVTQYQTSFMYEPLVRDLIRNRCKGTSCVLTQTNEEAVILVALLRKNGIHSKLVQSMDDIRFWNLAEIRYFLKYIDLQVKTPLISDDVWETAKLSTFKKYADSESLAYIRRCVELFEATSKVKYVSDFKEYVFESSIENFSDYSGTDVIVSTSHKVKGREFDDVYMLITDGYTRNDQLMRRYYVGMTRAKKRLFIHTNSSAFNRIPADKHLVNQQQYEMPEEIVLQLTHKDVNLGFFKSRKKEVLDLRGGSALTYADHCLHNAVTGRPVATLSNRMQQTLTEWQEKGYKPRSGDIIFFDWEVDGQVNHVGIVEKVENGRVYTIEGNRSDKVQQYEYDIEIP